MTNSMSSQQQPQQQKYVKQVDGVGFSLAGKVGKRERVRIETAVEEYIRRNYDLIRSHFEDGAASGASGGAAIGAASSAVRLCINRANNQVTIVSVNGTDVVPAEAAAAAAAAATAAAASGSSGSKCGNRRHRKSAAATAAPTAATATDSPQEQEKDSSIVAVAAAAAQPGDCREFADGGNGESMEAAIQYLMSRDQRGNGGGGGGGGGGGSGRLLRSSIPSLAATNNALSAQAAAPRLLSGQTLEQQKLRLQRKQQRRLMSQSTTDDTTTTAAAAVAAVANVRLVSEAYDCEARGAAFQRLFPSVRGDFFVFYDHGEAHCRKTLTAMGFTERKEEEETNGFRNIDLMSIMWCNGSISANKRRKGMGYHIVNRVRFRGLMTNKCSLVRTLAEFEVNHACLVPKGLEASSFLPPTVHLNGAGAIDIFHKIRQGGLYLIKPGYSDCGKGIVLYRSDGTLDSLINTLNVSYPNYPQKDLVLQKYVENPLLLGGKKFDLRVYLLVIPNQRKEVGVYAFVHPGYVRLACRDFDIDSDDLTLHLTNQAVQHRDKTYKTVKESTVWSPDTLNQYLNGRLAELKVPCADWVKRRMLPRVRAILAHMVSIVSSSLCDEPMSYELFGCDFLIDDEFNVWLLEVNSDPSLNKSTKVLRQIVTQVVEEGVALAVEVLQRAVRGAPIKSLVTQQDFKKVFSHTNESVLRCVMGDNRVRYPQHFVQ